MCGEDAEATAGRMATKKSESIYFASKSALVPVLRPPSGSWYGGRGCSHNQSFTTLAMAIPRRVFLAALVLCPGVAAQSGSPVWTCASSPPALLSVYSDASYDVAVGGTPWLTDGSVAVHANRVWLTSDAPAPHDLCTPIPDIDCVGNDLVNKTGLPSAAACCAFCESVPSCVAWSYQGDGHCFAKSGCDNPVSVPGGTSGTSGGAVAPLVMQSAGATSGVDEVGAWQGYAVDWSGNASGTPISVTTTFLCYTDARAIAFATSWPSGASATNTTHWESADGQPIAMFPSFAAKGAAATDLRWLHVSGIWTLFEEWGTGVDASLTGTDSPLWLLNTSAPEAGTLLLAPIDSLKAQVVGVWPDPANVHAPPRLAAGIYSSVTSVPAGFSSRYAIWPSYGGVSEAALTWGAQMQRVYNTQRLPTSRDVVNGKLSYFSDNGATLFQAYWDVHCPTRNCTAVSVPNGTNAESTFLALKASHLVDKIPASIYQLGVYRGCFWAPSHAQACSHSRTHHPFPLQTLGGSLNGLTNSRVGLLTVLSGCRAQTCGRTVSRL